jgi:hypothetical protein
LKTLDASKHCLVYFEQFSRSCRQNQHAKHGCDQPVTLIRPKSVPFGCALWHSRQAGNDRGVSSSINIAKHAMFHTGYFVVRGISLGADIFRSLRCCRDQISYSLSQGSEVRYMDAEWNLSPFNDGRTRMNAREDTDGGISDGRSGRLPQLRETGIGEAHASTGWRFARRRPLYEVRGLVESFAASTT